MMNSPFFLSDTAVQALGWTLFHSLWQGAAAASMLWLVRPRLRSARQRYWAAYLALITILAAAVVSFGLLYDPAVGTPAGVLPGAAGAGVLPDFDALTARAAPDFWTDAASWLEAWYPAIVSIWLVGFGFFLIQFAGGLYYVHRLRKRYQQSVDARWQETLDALAGQLRLSRPVQLLESALVQTPMALGFFKPLVLLPLGLINQLHPAEVEAILAHELAHIARRDWLFNLVQALIEALFYYHPAVWWISALVRTERENCCDDTAVALTGNRLAYAKTLVRLQDLAKTAKHPALVLGIDGAPTLLRRKPLLLERIKRILHQPQQSTSIMEKMIATGILLALLTLLTVRANTPPAFVESIREIAGAPMAWLAGLPQIAPAEAVVDSLPKPKQKQTIVHEDDNRKVEMELQGGKITHLKIDGADIAEPDYPKYRELTDDILRSSTPPPVPPVAPAAPFDWVSPPPPPAPGLAPGAPLPPLGPSSRISTDKDDQGNTIIRLERDGTPLEIRVKDGEVWVGDKKVEDGEALDLPPGNDRYFFWNGDEGQAFRLDGNRFFFEHPDGQFLEMPAPEMPGRPEVYHFDGDGQFLFKSPDGQAWPFPGPALDDDELKRIHEEALRGLKEQREDLEQQMRELEKEMKKNQKEWNKDQKNRKKTLEDTRRSLYEAERAQQEALAEVRVAQTRAHADALRAEREALAQARETQALAREKMRVAQSDQARAYRLRYSSESVGNALKQALVEDKIIGDSNNFSIELSGKELNVDGKKQSDDVHKKYLDLYRRRTGKELGKKDSIRIEEEN